MWWNHHENNEIHIKWYQSNWFKYFRSTRFGHANNMWIWGAGCLDDIWESNEWGQNKLLKYTLWMSWRTNDLQLGSLGTGSHKFLETISIALHWKKLASVIVYIYALCTMYVMYIQKHSHSRCYYVHVLWRIMTFVYSHHVCVRSYTCYVEFTVETVSSTETNAPIVTYPNQLNSMQYRNEKKNYGNDVCSYASHVTHRVSFAMMSEQYSLMRMRSFFVAHQIQSQCNANKKDEI